MKGKHAKQPVSGSPGSQASAHKQDTVTHKQDTVTHKQDTVVDQQTTAVEQHTDTSHSNVSRIVKRVLAVVACCLVAVYAGGVFYFSSHFYPHTTMATMDISSKSTDQVADMIADYTEDFSVKVTGLGFNLIIDPGDVNMTPNKDDIVASAAKAIEPWKWPYLILLDSHDMTEYLTASINAGELGDLITEHVDAFNEGATPPVNAQAVYDENKKAYKVEKEKRGTELSADAIMHKVDEALTTFESEVVLNADDLRVADIVSTDERFGPALEIANGFLKGDLEVTLDDNVVDHVDADLVNSWITFDENLEVALDETMMANWVAEIGDTYNSVGSERTYTRPDGKEVTVKGGVYGWTIDQSALLPAVDDAVRNGTIGTYEIPFSQRGNGLNPDAGMDWGAFCDVDLTEQHARYYDAAGNLLWESDVVTGTADSSDSTPTGVHLLNNKAVNQTLKGPMEEVEVPDPTEDDPDRVKKEMKPKWESPVAYWMPFIGNGYGLHDATWQSSFGGTRYKDGFGSHGCVNLPLDKAKELYDIIQVGDPVIVHW